MSITNGWTGGTIGDNRRGQLGIARPIARRGCISEKDDDARLFEPLEALPFIVDIVIGSNQSFALSCDGEVGFLSIE
jgi:hypothetical protein